MFDKVVKLVGSYPSDFKPTTNVMEVQKYFDAYEFYDARILAGEKWAYSSEHEDDLIIYNANVLMEDIGKVWYGDLNLTEDYLVLKDIEILSIKIPHLIRIFLLIVFNITHYVNKHQPCIKL